jgi:anti-sigma B factor antagonist
VAGLLQVIVGAASEPARLVGELDLSTAPLLAEAIHDRLGLDGDLVLDLSELTFIDSAGIRSLLDASHQLQGRGRLVLRSPTAAVSRVFEVVGIAGLPNLQVESDGMPTA